MQGKHTIFDTRRVSLDDDREGSSSTGQRGESPIAHVSPAPSPLADKREGPAPFKPNRSLHLIRARA